MLDMYGIMEGLTHTQARHFDAARNLLYHNLARSVGLCVCKQPYSATDRAFCVLSEGGMKNRRWLSGHNRVVTAVGYSLGTRQGYSGGWDVGCACGWQGGNCQNKALACKVYSGHIDCQINHCPIPCKRCGVEKLLSEMRPGYRYMCLKCASLASMEWKQRNPVRSARLKRDHHLRKYFGITVDEAEQLLHAQGGVCAICKLVITDRRGYSPHVDHDHVTGNVRGILCFNCNNGLGAFKDDIERLRSAIGYLERATQCCV